MLYEPLSNRQYAHLNGAQSYFQTLPVVFTKRRAKPRNAARYIGSAMCSCATPGFDTRKSM